MSDFKQLSDDELEQVTGGMDFHCFGLCLLNFGLEARNDHPDIVALAQLGDDVQLVLSVLNQGLLDDPMFAECWNAC